jgi:hypothetical protein
MLCSVALVRTDVSEEFTAYRLRSRKLRLTTVRDPPRSSRDILLSTKVGTKFRRQVAVAQSVYFACGLRATEFVSF